MANVESIYDKLKDVIIAYAEETGIVITTISMRWHDSIDGTSVPGEIQIDSRKL